LASEAFDFRDGHSLDADLRQGLFDMLHFEWFDDGFDLLHDMRVVNDCQGIASPENAPASNREQS
jgi:hypothetical protein